MTIRNFTFFSPNGTEFPVSSNADAKLYLMLSGMKLDTYKRTDWKKPVDTSLNRQYSNTSLVVGGRYFELENETVELQQSAVNYVHANIDLAKPKSPVSLSVELADNSNGIDINNSTGVLKQCFDIVTTDTMGVIGQRIPTQKTTLEALEVESFKNASDTDWFEVTKGAAFSGDAKIKRVNNSVVFIRIDLKCNNQLNYNIPITMVELGQDHPSIEFEFMGLARVAGKYVHCRIFVNTLGKVNVVPGETLPPNSTITVNSCFPLN